MPRLWNARGLSCAALFPGFLRRDLSLSSDKSHREKGWRGGIGGNRVTRHRGRDGVGWRETGTTHLRREREGWEVKVEMCVRERDFSGGFLALAGLSVMRDCSGALGPYNILPPEQTNCTHLQPTRSSAKTLGNHKRKPLLNIEHSQKKTLTLVQYYFGCKVLVLF